VNIPIVYEDDYLLVVDKPSGLLTVPNIKDESRTLTGILGLFPCHRLDRDTSGLIVYAKDKKTQQIMADKFKKREVHKTYIAFVNGTPSRREGVIKKRIEGKHAETKYKIIESKDDFSVVEVKPVTGRTNQIRIHFKSLGHPVLGDYKFAFRRDFKVKAKRLCLHAKSLRFKHPVTSKVIDLNSSLPVKLEELISE